MLGSVHLKQQAGNREREINLGMEYSSWNLNAYSLVTLIPQQGHTP